ncbi:hypothetical protein FA09DRAFT_102946 [Tilletiopsis washingtonensis]|uniref:Uncharacterized protein n=1 Tax=Tilletiopsis washingtonensis TaxID=58919 RepID=A0A316Z759_9BASI|nr:hypothetical protein FA09DRAFT_102946 [Tilletiopsis washingtonensis]PWN96003.1 hypothetical protein FA09DRAFT_102946 [Tilletiopsis washingtonensis]
MASISSVLRAADNGQLAEPQGKERVAQRKLHVYNNEDVRHVALDGAWSGAATGQARRTRSGSAARFPVATIDKVGLPERLWRGAKERRQRCGSKHSGGQRGRNAICCTRTPRLPPAGLLQRRRTGAAPRLSLGSAMGLDVVLQPSEARSRADRHIAMLQGR